MKLSILGIFVIFGVLPYANGPEAYRAIQPQIRGNPVFPSITQFPWMVSFQYEDSLTGNWHHYCGGAIIGKNSIATAAHCFFNNRTKYFIHTKIRTGDQNFTDTTNLNANAYVKNYDISTIIKHPGYQGLGPQNDLAIVFTKTEIEFNAATNRIALPFISDPIRAPNMNYSAKFTGYGYFDNTTTTSDALREADFIIYTGSYCEPLFGNPKIKNHLVNTSILICAGAANDSTWTCGGDSGGPLVHEWRQQYFLLGVLHGSSTDPYTCHPARKSLFNNIEEQGNLEFVLKWKERESSFLEDNLKDLENHSGLSINFLKHLAPSPATQSLWTNYTDNEDIFHAIVDFNPLKSIFFKGLYAVAILYLSSISIWICFRVVQRGLNKSTSNVTTNGTPNLTTDRISSMVPNVTLKGLPDVIPGQPNCTIEETVTPDVTPDVTSDVTPDVTSDVTSDAMPARRIP